MLSTTVSLVWVKFGKFRVQMLIFAASGRSRKPFCSGQEEPCIIRGSCSKAPPEDDVEKASKIPRDCARRVDNRGRFIGRELTLGGCTGGGIGVRQEDYKVGVLPRAVREDPAVRRRLAAAYTRWHEELVGNGCLVANWRAVGEAERLHIASDPFLIERRGAVSKPSPFNSEGSKAKQPINSIPHRQGSAWLLQLPRVNALPLHLEVGNGRMSEPHGPSYEGLHNWNLRVYTTGNEGGRVDAPRQKLGPEDYCERQL
jgi:hypothetical protein